MAGDWIKMRTDLYDDPRVIRLTSELCPKNVLHRSFRYDVLGRLLVTWSVANQHTIDGRLEGYTPEILDGAVEMVGWTEALKHVGWMVIEPQALVIPEFEKHNGESAKRRLTDRERKRAERAGENPSEICPGKFGQESDQRREEKRTIKPPLTPRGARTTAF